MRLLAQLGLAIIIVAATYESALAARERAISQRRLPPRASAAQPASG